MGKNADPLEIELKFLDAFDNALAGPFTLKNISKVLAKSFRDKSTKVHPGARFKEKIDGTKFDPPMDPEEFNSVLEKADKVLLKIKRDFYYLTSSLGLDTPEDLETYYNVPDGDPDQYLEISIDKDYTNTCFIENDGQAAADPYNVNVTNIAELDKLKIHFTSADRKKAKVFVIDPTATINGVAKDHSFFGSGFYTQNNFDSNVSILNNHNVDLRKGKFFFDGFSAPAAKGAYTIQFIVDKGSADPARSLIGLASNKGDEIRQQFALLTSAPSRKRI